MMEINLLSGLNYFKEIEGDKFSSLFIIYQYHYFHINYLSNLAYIFVLNIKGIYVYYRLCLKLMKILLISLEIFFIATKSI